MARTRIGWGIVGPGAIAARFAGDLPESKTGRLVAVGSRDGTRAEDFVREHAGRQGEKARAYAGYDGVLADDEVDAVYIATPHPMHAAWAIKAAEAGKHVLCEKPLTINSAETMAVIEAARRNDVFLMEAYMYRCNPQTTKIVELVRDGSLGEVHQIEGAFAFQTSPDPTKRALANELAGGGILDVGGYPVSMACLLAGVAAGERVAARPVSVTGVGHLGETGVDEWAAASLQFASDVTAHVRTGVRLNASHELRVVGSQGFLVADSPWVPGRNGEPTLVTVHRVGQQPEVFEFPVGPEYSYEADSVAAHLDERESPAMPWSDTVVVAEVLDRWREAIGLRYEAEHDDAMIPTVHGRPLVPGSTATMPTGSIPGVTKPISRLVMGADNQRSLAHASVMFDDFVERGGNCFDSAYIYGGGNCEKLLGRWVTNRGIRDEIVVIGKGAHTPHCDPESITRQLHESLERQQTDYLDVYFMHRDNTDVPVGEFVDVLDEHLRAGRVHAYGGSNWSMERLDEANAYARANGRAEFVAVSNNFSLARALDVPWKGCLSSSDDASRQWLEKHRLALMPWSSQARGFFTGRAAPERREDEELVRCWYSDDNFERLARAQQLAAQRGVDPTAIALAYVLHQDFPTFPLIGPRTLAETRSSLAGLRVELSPHEVRWLDLRA